MTIHVDLSPIDLCDLIEQQAPATRLGKAYGNGEKRTRKGACPWCGGTDRFAVVESDPQHFYCGIHGGQSCGKHGNAIDFMMQWHNIGFMDACTRLGVQAVKDGQPVTPSQRTEKIHLNIDRMPAEPWREMAAYFLARCQNWLWKEPGRAALAALRARGFSDEQIRACGYGYNPKTLFDRDLARWGITDDSAKAVWLPRGLVIPWFVGGNIWKLSIRRLKADLQEEQRRTGRIVSKYISVKGGSNPLYRVDTIIPGLPLIIFEGEFNADILAQVLADAGITDVAVVATGSTGKGRADNWLLKMVQASPILISFDPDGAGASAAKDHWAKVLPQALQWPCVGGDMNEMYLAGADVVAWLQRGLRLAGSRVIPASVSSPAGEPDPLCFACGSVVEYYTDQGTPCCAQHYDERQASEQDAQEEREQVTAEHLARHLYTANRSRQNSEQVPSTDPLTRFAQTVDRIADIFAPCTVTRDPPGYTLQEHARLFTEQQERARIEKEASMRQLVQDRRYEKLHKGDTTDSTTCTV